MTVDSHRFTAEVGYIPVNGARLFYREIGRGRPLIVLHGGPDFDHHYLLPAMDMLADMCRLIYYDQRGRGGSAGGVEPETVSMRSETEDLDRVRQFIGIESVALLGHSWGCLLAMEYAASHPGRVSHLILLNTAPASRDDFLLFRGRRQEQATDDLERKKEVASTAMYAEGDLEADLDYYRAHFGNAFVHPEHLEVLLATLRTGFTNESILKARRIEDRLNEETWLSSHYDLPDRLTRLSVPTLLIHGDHDLVPIECAAHISEAIPGARLIVLNECGHFSFIECPIEIHSEIAGFLGS